VVVELKPVDIAKIARLVDAQDYGLEKAIEAAKQVLRRHLEEIPRADCMFDRLERGILADTLVAAKHERVIDLLVWPLHPVRQPHRNVVGVGTEHPTDMLKPRAGTGSIARLNCRRTIQVKAAHPAACDPAAFRN
jgi:hypothetical protein